jgi:hypothetical protein
MLDLIRRDFRLHKKFILFLGVFYLVYIGFFGSRLEHPSILSVIVPFLCVIFPVSIFGREDRFKSLCFALSLPTTRDEFLRARYALSWILMGAVYAASTILMVVFPGGKLRAAAAFDLRQILMTLAFMTLFFGILMPLSVRFGWMGLIVFLIALQILGAVVLILRLIIRGVLPLIRTVPRAIDVLLSSLGPAGGAAAVVLVLVLLNVASFRVGAAVFRAKEF